MNYWNLQNLNINKYDLLLTIIDKLQIFPFLDSELPNLFYKHKYLHYLLNHYKINNDLDNSKYKIYPIDRENSLKDKIEAIVQDNNVFNVIIFNNSKENLFETYGINSGLLLLFYSAIFWRNYPVYLIMNNNKIYFGAIDVANYRLYSLEEIQADRIIEL